MCPASHFATLYLLFIVCETSVWFVFAIITLQTSALYTFLFKIFFVFIEKSNEMEFTNGEMADMHFCYGMANGSNLEARRLYRERFPNRRIPDRRIFEYIHRRLRETGQFAQVRVDLGRNRMQRNVRIEGDVIQRVEADPDVSTRRLAAEFGVSHQTIWRIIHDAGYYPYHLQRVQALYPGDRYLRLDFCHWFLDQPRHGFENFGYGVLFTDESQFTRNGINNFHNRHLWDIENPHGIVESGHQQRFSLNVWGGMIGNFLLGPVFLPPRLDGRNYHHFLVHTLPELLEDIPVNGRRRMWFMHDGAPAHFSHLARDWLSQPFNYGNRWIGRGGPIAWPPRSPDLNPLDYFVWGHCKALVYARPVNDVGELRQRVIDAFETIRNMNGIFHRVNESLYRRLEACVLANGGHFEQLI